MNHYTEDQIRRLSEIFRSERIYPGFLYRVYSSGLHGSELESSPEIYNVLSKKVERILVFWNNQVSKDKNNYEWVKKMMYDLPLEDMPLYLNDYVLGVIAKWRLEMSR